MCYCINYSNILFDTIIYSLSHRFLNYLWTAHIITTDLNFILILASDSGFDLNFGIRY